MISVIIRFKNEASYLGAVLHAVRNQQTREQIEVVAVDNLSDDGSRQLASDYADLLLDIDDYRPGAALNKAIDGCSGSAVVILSAHAIPANDTWLTNLASWLPNPAVLGTYGSQLYPITSRFLDKRDLDIFSSLRPRTERRDSDFWNANSIFQRKTWEKEQFDEDVYELEDHHWTKLHLAQGGQWVRFEPTALVYHYGHEARNDRTFLPPSPLTDQQRIHQAISALMGGDEPWPVVMSAGLTLSSLSHVPEAADAIPALGHVLATHEDFDVRWRVAGALGRIASTESVAHLVRALTDPSFYVRDEAAWSLGRLGRLSVPHLQQIASSLELDFQPFAALAIGLTGDRAAGREAVDLIRRCLGQDHQHVRRDALYFLGEITAVSEAASLAPVVACDLAADDDDLARAATWCWGALAGKHHEAARPHIPTILDLARHHPVETIRYEAVVALGKAAPPHPSAELVKHLRRVLHEDGAGRVRYAAMQSLRLLSSAGVTVPVCAGHDTDPDFGVRFEHRLFLEQTGNQ
ncbi:MAG: HEAT repeat domain-containing protein [Pseudonocardiaceae bacterium]